MKFQLAINLERIDDSTTHGIRCKFCAWEEETTSSWLLAEDDADPLEDIVLSQRSRNEARDSAVDTRSARD